MKDFNEYWKEKNENAFKQPDQSTDIACPDCGKELSADYSITLTSIPPKHRAWCKNKKCGWNGYI